MIANVSEIRPSVCAVSRELCTPSTGGSALALRFSMRVLIKLGNLARLKVLLRD